MTTLVEIAQVNPRLGAVLADDFEVSFLGMADVSEDGSTSAGILRRFEEVKKGYTPFENGDLLVAKITPCFENGKIAQAAIGSPQGYGSTEFHVIRVDESQVDARYLLHFLRSPRVRVTGELRMIGSAGQRRVPKAFLEDLDIPLPPLPEQHRIASILDQADALRAKRRNMLDILDRLEVSIFESCFPLPANVGGLDALPRLGDYAAQITDGEHQTPRRAAAGKMLLSARNVRNGRLDFTDVDFVDDEEFDRIAKRCRPVRGDVLISCSGTVGRVATVETDEPIVLVRSVALIRPTAKIMPKYLEHYLRTPRLQHEIFKRSRSSAQANLFQGPIRSLPILVPPLTAQESFVRSISKVSTLGLAYARALAHLDELFASLQSRAFKGEL